MVAPPLRYARECGPTALAAVMGTEPEDVAPVLWGHRSPPPGAPTAGPGGSGPLGTWPHDLASVLIRCGWGVELHDAAGQCWLDAYAYPRFLANRAHRMAREVRRIATRRPTKAPAWSKRATNYATPIPRVDPLAAVPLAEQAVRPLTVARWLRDFRASTWILFVAGHVLAARAGKIIAGGETYGRHHVTDALRVIPPQPREG